MGAAFPHVEPSAASIRAELDKILASAGFASSERLARFLRYVVDETLEGRSDGLKETTVGVDVFGRKPGYDPRIDGVVRTEAIKLRARLKEYYETEGGRDPLRIDLPKGGYVPSFSESQVERGPVPERTVSGRWVVLAIALVALTVTTVAGVWLYSRPRATGVPGPSIAVLPFVDLSEEKNQQYFCDGMTEQIIDALSHVPGFQVVARSSMFALHGPQDIREVGRRFNVRTVLEGSVRRSGNTVRVTAQLNNVSDGFHLWSQTYERQIQDIFTLQDEISRAIVDTLQLKLSGPLVKTPQADLEAYNLYLQGRYEYFKWTHADVRRSIDLFEQAVAKEPGYAPAYAGIADAYSWLGFFHGRPRDSMPKARVAAEKALALDERLDEAHVALGEVKALYDFDWTAAGREFDRALQINPGCTNARFSHAITYLAPLGRTKEAIQEMRAALDVDPLNAVLGTYLGTLYYLDRQFDAAAAELKRVLESSPNFHEAHGMLFRVYLDAGKLQEARRELDRINAPTGQSTPDLTDAALLAREGHVAQAREALAHCVRLAKNTYVGPLKFACTYAAMGDISAGLNELDRAYEERDGMLAFMKTWPSLDPLRGEPRFKALLAKIGLQ
jgi:serine/threonine-protein kinase